MKAQVISFRCVLKTKFGRVISSTMNRDVVTAAPEGDGFPLRALADGLQNLRAGEKRSIALRADQAYGYYDPKLAITRSREELPGAEGLKIGDQVELSRIGSDPLVYRVVSLSSEMISLDANHPLAGQDLVFEIETLTARDATPEDFNESDDAKAADERRTLH